MSTDAKYSFEITENMTLTAVFTLAEESQEQQDGETDGGGGNHLAAPEPKPAILPQDGDDIDNGGNAPEYNGGDAGPEAIEE